MKPTILRWCPILVGVDGSPEATRAAIAGSQLAEATGTRCHLVHAVTDPGSAFAAMVLHEPPETLEQAAARLVRPRLRAALQPYLPPSMLDTLRIRIGRPAAVLAAEADRLGSGLVILGAKRRLVKRWPGGGVIHQAVRTLRVPVLVTRGTPRAIKRVLVGLTRTAEPVIREAERFTVLAGGQLRAVHVLEPLPVLPTPKVRVAPRLADLNSVELFERELWPLVRLPEAQRTVRAGDPAAALAAEAAAWHADLLVVGSPEKRWWDRLWFGTVTEGLLDHLRVSLLAVPARSRS